jgi:DNA-binding HxlR family transcriptional regulator
LRQAGTSRGQARSLQRPLAVLAEEDSASPRSLRASPTALSGSVASLDADVEFAQFHEQSRAFSRRMRATLGGVAPADGRIRAAENVHVARTMFGKWSLEILSALYGQRSVGFEDLRRSLHGITASVLSYRLKRMESLGMVAREVQTTRPVRVRYRLTDKGLTVAVLGEPVFLFLQYSESKERRSGRGSSARE